MSDQIRTRYQFIAVFVVILALSFTGMAQTVQYVTLVTTNPWPGVQYSVQTNQIVSLVGLYSGGNGGYISGNFPDGKTMSFSMGSGQFQLFTGLTNVNVSAAAGSGIICGTVQVTTPASANVISNYVPADAIVIPASATGNVQIILESSTDLVNWTAANPGTYAASSATNRFFRVRAALN